MTGQTPQSPLDSVAAEELECKICYCPYSLSTRRPKVLECCHRLCAKCLDKILDLGECPPNAVVCPFCRNITALPGEAVGSLPDDCNLVAALALQVHNSRNLPDGTEEILLSPRHLSALMPSATSASSSSLRSSNYVVITIMEPQRDSGDLQPGSLATLGRDYRSSSLDSMASITQRWTVWNCAAMLCQTSARGLMWLLGLMYVSSLPLGVYLLIMQKATIGVLLVSVVPASLLVLMIYGFCQCLCYEFWEGTPP